MSDPTSTKTRSEIRELICRSSLYSALSLLYRHPASLPEDVSLDEEARLWQEAVQGLNYDTKNELAASLDGLLDRLHKTDRQKWTELYEACFAHTPHGPVPCYELEYGEEHTYRQPAQLGDIAAFYQAFGLKLNDSSHERVDHIVIECEFMNFLLYKQTCAAANNQHEQAQICQDAAQRFLSEHVGRWAPAFAMRLYKFEKENLFNKIADFTLLFIVGDCQHLGIKAGQNDLPVRNVNEKMDAGCVSCSLKPEFQQPG